MHGMVVGHAELKKMARFDDAGEFEMLHAHKYLVTRYEVSGFGMKSEITNRNFLTRARSTIFPGDPPNTSPLTSTLLSKQIFMLFAGVPFAVFPDHSNNIGWLKTLLFQARPALFSGAGHEASSSVLSHRFSEEL